LSADSATNSSKSRVYTENVPPRYWTKSGKLAVQPPSNQLLTSADPTVTVQVGSNVSGSSAIVYKL
jgi:hypothetical protein